MRRNPVFTSMEALEETLNRRRYSRSRTRRLDESDIDEFEKAGNFRRSIPEPPKSIAQTKKMMRSRNMVRWMRLNSDVRWAKRQLKKMGRNPNDLWLLFD